MATISLAVYDCSADYVNRFLAFFKYLPDNPFQAVGFTNLKSLQDYLTISRIDILLLSEDSLFNEYVQNNNEKEVSIPLWLRAGNSVRELIILGEQQDLNSNPPKLNRYRSMKLLLKDLIKISGGLSAGITAPAFEAPDIIGIHSPYLANGYSIFHIMRSSALLPESKNLLYIPLDYLNGINQKTQDRPGPSLSDLIFAYKTQISGFNQILRDCTYISECLSMIPGPNCPEDLDEISADNWSDFLKTILDESECSRICLDIPSGCKNLLTLLGLCKTIYCLDWEYKFLTDKNRPQLYTDPAYAREAAFVEFLEAGERYDILEKFSPVQLPSAESAVNQSPPEKPKELTNGINRRFKNKTRK